MKTISRITAITTVIIATGFAGMASADRGGQPGRGMPLDFTAIDTNTDQALDRAELTAHATARVTVIDVDGDGVLTREELIASFPERGGAMSNLFGADRSERMANRILALHGATEAGQVAIDDVVTMRVNELFSRVDDNSDGTISSAEMEQMSKMHRGKGRGRDHARMDRDGPRDGMKEGPRHAPQDTPESETAPQ